MAVGRLAILTFPLAACTVVGNDEVAAPAGSDPIGPAGTMLATTGAVSEAKKTAMVAVARLMFLNIDHPPSVTEDEVRPIRLPMGGRTNRPSSEDWLRRHRSGVWARPLVAGSLTIAGQRRNSTGLR